MSKKKKPFVGAPVPQAAKTPRVAEQPNVEGMKFCWRVSDIDRQGQWGWSKATCEQLLGEIIPRLHGFIREAEFLQGRFFTTKRASPHAAVSS